MKIININYSDDNSGASIAVKRINKIFNNINLKSKIVNFKKQLKIKL